MSGLVPVGSRSPSFVTPELLKQLCVESKKAVSVAAMELMKKLFILEIPHDYISQHPESIITCLKTARHLQKHSQIKEYEIDRIIAVMRPVLQEANLATNFEILDKDNAVLSVNSTLFKLACPQFFADKSKCFKKFKLFNCSLETIEVFKKYLETRTLEAKNLTSREIIESCQLGTQFSNKLFEQYFLHHLQAYAKTITTEVELEKFIEDLKIYSACGQATLNQLHFAAFQNILKTKGHTCFSLPIESSFLFTDVRVFYYLLNDQSILYSFIKIYVKGVVVEKLEDIEPLLCLSYLPKGNKIDLKAISLKVPVDLQILNEIQKTFPKLQYLDVGPMVLGKEKSLVSYAATELKKLTVKSSIQYLCFLNQEGTNIDIEYAPKTSKRMNEGLFPCPIVFCSQEGIVSEIAVSFSAEFNKTDLQIAFKAVFNRYTIEYPDQNVDKLRSVKLRLKPK